MGLNADTGIHRKPAVLAGQHAFGIGLLNVAGYYDQLTTFLDHTVAEQFVKPAHRATLMVEQSPEVLLDRFANYVPPSVHK